MTYAPAPGCTDAQRNCISNIRPEGLGYDVAGRKLVYLLEESVRRGLSGVHLKDEFNALAPPVAAVPGLE
jgi:ethanolamine ammonia-lyase small subunit